MWLDHWKAYVPYFLSFVIGLMATVGFTQHGVSPVVAPVVVLGTLAMSAPWARARAAVWWAVWVALGFVLLPLMARIPPYWAYMQGAAMAGLVAVVTYTRRGLVAVQIVFLCLVCIAHKDGTAPSVPAVLLFVKTTLFFFVYTVYDILYRHVGVARGQRETLKLLQAAWVLFVHRYFLPLCGVQFVFALVLLWRRLAKHGKTILPITTAPPPIRRRKKNGADAPHAAPAPKTGKSIPLPSQRMLLPKTRLQTSQGH